MHPLVPNAATLPRNLSHQGRSGPLLALSLSLLCLGLGAPAAVASSGYPTNIVARQPPAFGEVSPNLITTAPYRYTGLITARFGGTGSGSAVGSNRTVVSCAHVVWDESDNTWLPGGSMWYLGYNSRAMPNAFTTEGAIPLIGYRRLASYAALATSEGVTSHYAFDEDFVVHYSYQRTSPTESDFGTLCSDPVGALEKESLRKVITGYPANPFGTGDTARMFETIMPYQEFYVHSTATFLFGLFKASGHKRLVEGDGPEGTGDRDYHGNSGGPLWIKEDVGWRQAAVLVGGRVSEDGLYFIIPDKPLLEQTISLALGLKSANDDWKNPIPLKMDGPPASAGGRENRWISGPFSNVGASLQPGEPSSPLVSRTLEVPRATVWFLWTARSNTRTRISVIESMQMDQLTHIDVYRRTSDGSPGQWVTGGNSSASIWPPPLVGEQFLVRVGFSNFVQSTFKLDYGQYATTPPVLDPIGAPPFTGQSGTVSVSGTDIDSAGVVRLKVFLNGAIIAEQGPSPTNVNSAFSFPGIAWSSNARGTFPLTVEVIDGDGLSANRTTNVTLTADPLSTNVFESDSMGGALLLPVPAANQRVTVFGSSIGGTMEEWERAPEQFRRGVPRVWPEVPTIATRTVWWKWTAPAHGFLILKTSGRFPHKLDVFDGASLMNATLGLGGIVVGSASSRGNGDFLSIEETALQVRVQKDQTYWFRVAGLNGAAGDIELGIEYRASNVAPAAFPANELVFKNEAKTFMPGVGDPDGDRLTWRIVTPPQHGNLTSGNGSISPLSFTYPNWKVLGDRFHYTPAANYEGPDSFTFVVSDGELESASATVEIQVRRKNGPGVPDVAFVPLEGGAVEPRFAPMGPQQQVFFANGLARFAIYASASGEVMELVGLNADGSQTADGPRFGFAGLGGARIGVVETGPDGTVFVGGRFDAVSWGARVPSGDGAAYTGFAVFLRGVDPVDVSATVSGSDALRLGPRSPGLYPPQVFAMVPLADGALLIGGDFEGAEGGRVARYLERLVPGVDGTGHRIYVPDTTFVPGTVQGPVRDIDVDDEGRIYVVSDAHPFVYRLLANGTVDPTFIPPAVSDPGRPLQATDFVEVSGEPFRGFDSADNRSHRAFWIGRYEVTNTQYAAFLNAVASVSDPHGLYSATMQSSPHGGITRQSAGAGFSYVVKPGFASKPVNFVSQEDAARFVNWLSNGGGAGTDTGNGTYTLRLGQPFRNRGALFFLPKRDPEFVMAGYYDRLNDYSWQYSTQSDTLPTPEPPPGGVNSANYYNPPTRIHAVGTVSNVGAYTQSPSPYGTFDQGGNAMEYMEFSDDGNNAAGGGWNDAPGNMELSGANYASEGDGSDPEFGSYSGFRVAALAGLNPIHSVVLIRDLATNRQKAVLGGSFRSVNGASVPGLVRLLENGTVDSGFHPTATMGGAVEQPILISALLASANGTLLVGGDFLMPDASTVGRVFRLNADGTVDPAFLSESNLGASVHSLVADPAASRFLVGGLLRGSIPNYTSTAVRRYSNGNTPPSVSLMEFPSASDIAMGGVYALAADASDLDGEIAQVRFFVNGELAGSVVDPPYGIPWTVPTTFVGDGYQIYAEAEDNEGAVTRSMTMGFGSRDSGGIMPESMLMPGMLGNVTGTGPNGEVLMTLPEDGSVEILLAPVDIPGRVLQHVVEEAPGSGVVEEEFGGRLVYRPNANFFGTDRLVIRTQGSLGDAVFTTFEFTVNPLIDPPQAGNLSVSVPMGTPVAFHLPVVDPDSSGFNGTITISPGPVSGNLTRVGLNATYTPQVGFVGEDAFTFNATTVGGSVQGNVTITVYETVVPTAALIAAPTGVQASDGTYAGAVLVTWNAAAGAETYEVWRQSTASDGEFSRLEVKPGALALLDTGLTADETQIYFVIAASEALGSSDLSESDSGFAGGNGTSPGLPLVHVSGDGNFGGVSVGRSAQRPFLIENLGNMPLAVTAVTAPPGFVGSWSGTIPAGGNQSVNVTFQPGSTGVFGGNLTVLSNATVGLATRTLNGTGTATPPFESWISRYLNPMAPEAARGFDADADGLDNLTELAFGLNPTAADAGSPNLPRVVADPGWLTLEFNVATGNLSTVDNPPITYIGEWSVALAPPWTPVVPALVSGSTYRVRIPIDGAPRKYLRLRIQDPNGP